MWMFAICTFSYLISALKPEAESYLPVYNVTSQVTNGLYTAADLVLVEETNPIMGHNLKNLKLEVFYNTDTSARIKITDKDNQRWEPDDYPNPLNGHLRSFDVKIKNSPGFHFTIERTSGEVLFDTSYTTEKGSIYFSDQYIELGTWIPSSPNIFGLGERVTSFKLDTDSTFYTIWNLAQDCPYDTGKGERGRNMYGHYPFYLEVRQQSAIGVYFHNSNAMDVVFEPNKLKFKTTGGIIDMFVFLADSVPEVMNDYYLVVGKPSLPPFWALGFHQCRWGYTDLSTLVNVVSGYNAHDIPLDVLWSDIDYMISFKDFTLDESRYPLANFKAFIDSLHSDSQHFVPIVDAGISATDYFAFTEGQSKDVFIKRTNSSEEYFYGQVWPGKSVFVDFFHPEAQEYWSSMLDKLYEKVEFDGIWLDMNEASSFCDGECAPYYSKSTPKITLPYVPGNHSLSDQVLSLSASHHGGILEYDAHALFGTMETQATYNYLSKKMGTRPFIISRSSRPGHGQYGGHWLGDNFSNWEQLRYSIAGVFNFQMFGVPLVGADVCGFHNNTTTELCARWIELGAFYPFFRNHNDIGAMSQEFFALGDEIIQIAKKMIGFRYSLSMYMYSVLHSSRFLFRPLMYETLSIELYDYQEEQFFWGPNLLVLPALYEGQTTVKGYLPGPHSWFSIFDGTEYKIEGWTDFYTPRDSVNVLLRSGAAVPMQNSEKVLRITDMRSKDIAFALAFGKSDIVDDEFFFDDGVTIDAPYSSIKVQGEIKDDTMKASFSLDKSMYTGDDYKFFGGNFTFFGMPSQVKKVTSSSEVLSFYQTGTTLMVDIKQSSVSQTLTVEAVFEGDFANTLYLASLIFVLIFN